MLCWSPWLLFVEPIGKNTSDHGDGNVRQLAEQEIIAAYTQTLEIRCVGQRGSLFLRTKLVLFESVTFVC